MAVRSRALLLVAALVAACAVPLAAAAQSAVPRGSAGHHGRLVRRPHHRSGARIGVRVHLFPYRFGHRYYGAFYGYRPYYRPYYGGFFYRPYFSYYSYYRYYRPYGYYRSYRYYGPYAYGYDHHYGAAGYAYDRGAVRTLVEPKETEIYVDGYYAGIADDFDGVFQRLYLEPGEHELEFRLEGYRDARKKIFVQPGHTYKIHHRMERLAPGETNPRREALRPDDGRRRLDEARRSEWRREDERRPRRPERVYRDDEARRERRGSERRPAPARTVGFGMLSVRVQPPDAEVLVDGEPWGTLEGFEELVIHLPAGPHRIEIRREGFRPFATEVTIREGETTPLNVRLAPVNL